MADQSRNLSDLSTEQKRELLKELLRKKTKQPVPHEAVARETPPLRRLPRHLELPLSFAQERLWFLDQLQPGSAVYNIPCAVRLTGLLDPVSVQQSLNETVRRHETLRTTFGEVDGRPVQVIAPSLLLEVPVVDLTALPPAKQEVEVQRLATEEAERPFDLSCGPLLRTTLLRLAVDEHVVLLTMHHIVSDAWSMGVLVRELIAGYLARAGGHPLTLPDLPVQYADFASWQREWLEGPMYETQLAYWRQQLTGAPGLLELPTDRPRPALRSHRGERTLWPLSHELSDRVRSLSRREGVTLFMTMLAVFQTLLARYSGQDDIVVGAPIANRTRSDVEGLIGVFVNTLVMRTDLSGNPTFRELLGRVRQVAVAAYAHQDLPFEKLVDELQPQRGLNHTPLFQVMLVFPPVRLPETHGRSASFVQVHSGTAKFDLILSVVEATGPLELFLEYDTDLFAGSTAQRVLTHLQAMLAAIVANPEQRLSELPVLIGRERVQILETFNNTTADYPRQYCIHDLFEMQAARTPNAIALVFEDQQLTYTELNRRAERLARTLLQRGVGPDKFVAVWLEPSVEMVVSVLAVLKAGGAYVPLDPLSPPERLRILLEDARPTLILTQQHLLARAPEHAAEVLCLDPGWELEDVTCDIAARRRASPENLAYVIYTSGSTGRPKGVLIEHRQLCNYVFAIIDHLGISAGASYALVQPLTVDSCKTTIFPPLLTGGSLHVLSKEIILNPEATADYFEQHDIDCLKIAPSHLAALQAAVEPQRVMPKRWLITGGEASQRDWFEHLQTLAPSCVVFNHYGPTEATVGMLTYRSPQNGVERATNRTARTPLGSPLPNTQAYVLDRWLQPVPVGVPGELYIGGACLARGYLQRPDLTGEKFIPNPFSCDPGERLYRTGDKARWLAEGNIEFMGRLDFQVKIRGFRVEPGEVEAALLQHPTVRETIVIASLDHRGEQRLAAYVVPRRDTVVNGNELRRFLYSKLPGYMVPAVFAPLDSLPLTRHGKVDLNALPALPDTAPNLGEMYVAPRTETERAVAAIWAEVLQVEKVGIRDNFFDAGGHSLLIVQVQSKLNRKLATQIPVVEFFRQPTIELLARYLDEAGSHSAQRLDRSRETAAGKRNLRQMLDRAKSG
jgi:amino acid adenylation domain-containing protein